MKKLILLFSIITFFLISCASNPFTVWYDKNVDREMSAELTITGGIEINQLNDEVVKFWGDRDKVINVLAIIPAGTHYIYYSCRPQRGFAGASRYVYSNNVPMEYTFKAGRKYALLHLDSTTARSMNIQWQEGMVHIIETTYLESKWF